MRSLSANELTRVAGGSGCHCPEPGDSKGNNGWGNGGDDGINSPKVDGGFKVPGDSDGFAGIQGGGREKLAR
jgi:hypothetical protein